MKKIDKAPWWNNSLMLVLILLSSSLLKAQEDFFSPLVVDKQAVKSYKHDYISIVHGPGQVRFEMPLGHGLEIRGLRFQPKIIIQPAQKTSSDQTGSCGWDYVWVSANGVKVNSWFSSGSQVGLFYNAGGAITQPPMLIPSGYNPDSMLPVSAPATNWKIAGFDQEMGSITSASDMGGLTMTPLTHEANILLPDGRGCSSHSIPETYLVTSQYSDLLNQFGYSINQLSTYGSVKTTDNGMLFSLLGSSGLDISLRDDTASYARGPGKYVLVKNGVAYEYEYLTFHQYTLPVEYDQTGDPISSSRFAIDKFYYRLKAIKNKFGDQIVFTYGVNDFDYTAEIYVNGQATGKKIIGTLTTASASPQIPDLGSPSSSYRSFILPADLGDVIIQEIDGNGTSYSARINGGLRASINTRNIDGIACQLYENKRVRFQASSIKISNGGSTYDVNISYEWLSGYLSYGWPNGLNVGAVAISQIEFPGGELYKFNYAPTVYHAGDDSNADWEPMAWPIQSIEHRDANSLINRTTTYSRKVPVSTNVLSGVGEPGNSTWQYVREWINRDSYEAETLPDGKTIVRKFVPPQTITARISPISLPESDRAQYDAYFSGTMYEERTYPSGGNWESGIMAPDPNVISLKYFDEWDPSDNSKIDTHPYGVAPDELVTSSVYSRLYPTRIITWNSSTKTTTVEKMLNWSNSAKQWTENHQVFVPNITDPWNSFSLDYKRFSDSLANRGIASALPGQIDRSIVTTYKSIDFYLNFGDWTKKEFFENGAVRLPTVNRTSNPKNGVTLSEERLASDGNHVRKEFTYASETTGVPQQIAYASDSLYGTDGTVGVQIGYDLLYRVSQVQKLGFGYVSSRELNFDDNPTSITDINSYKYSYEWDGLGRLTSESRPNSEIGSIITYNDASLSQTISRGLQESNYFFNVFGELIRISRKDGSGNSGHKKIGYDLAGRKIWESPWITTAGSNQGWDQQLTGVGSQWSYDEWNRITKIIDPNGVSTDLGYQGLNKTISVAFGTPLVATSTHVHDVLGRLVKVVDPVGHVTTYDYDSADRLVSVRQFPTSSGTGAGTIGTGTPQVRFWIYDGLGRLVILEQPESQVTYFSSFDVMGNPKKTVYGLPSGWRPTSLATPDSAAYSVAGVKTVTRTYDTMGRIGSAVASDGSINQAFSYDEASRGASNGKLTTATSEGISRMMWYGGLNGRLSVHNLYIPGLDPFTQGVGYDNYGNLTSRTYPENRAQSIPYDQARGLPTGIAHNATNMATLAYDQTHWGLSGITYNNGASSFIQYDPDQIRLHRLTHTIGGSTLKDWLYSYDLKNRLETDSEDWFEYDPLDRLTTVKSRDFDSASNRTNGASIGVLQSLNYDAFGNRIFLDSKAILNWPSGSIPPASGAMSTTTTSKSSTYSFNPSDAFLSLHNQLPQSTLTGVLTGAQYDSPGNLIRIYGKQGDSSTQISLIYDALGRVKSMADSAKNTVENYSYDDRGLRVVVETYQGSVAPQNLLKKKYCVYNEAQQLVSEYEQVLE